MYKKITHTIVEEHFDCPEAVDIAASVESGDSILPMRFRVTPAAVMPADEFKIKVEDWFLENDARWQNLLDATFNSNLDYEQAIEDVFVTADELGNFLKGYYGVEFSERFNQQWRSIAMNLLFIWRNYRNGWDNSVQISRTLDLTTYIGLLLNQYNQLWDRQTFADAYQSLVNDYIELGNARKNKNAALEASIKTRIGTKLNQFSTMISSGVMQQFPNMFTAVQ